MKKIPRTAKIGRGCRSSPIWLSEEFFEYIASQLLGIAQSYRILHGGEKIWISCLSGKSYISRVSAPQEHKIHIFELTCNVNVLMTPFLTIFRRFPTTFRGFPKIFQNCSEGQSSVSEHFPNNFEHFPKINENCRRLPKTTEEDPKMFRSYTKECHNHNYESQLWLSYFF